MSSKKSGIKFIVEEPIHERTPVKSIIIPRKNTKEADKETRKSEISVRSLISNASVPSDVSASRARSISIYGIRGSSFRHHRQTSVPTRKTMTLQPTYQLAPLWPYERSYVLQIMNQCVNKSFDSYQYDVRTIDRLCQRTTIAMEKRITGLRFNRYRNVCLVIAGEKFYQDLMIATGFLWDKNNDLYDMYLLDRPDFFVLAIVYGVYYD